MKKALSLLLTLSLLLASALSFAEPVHVRPLEITEDSYDLDNGEFRVDMDISDDLGDGPLTMDLYLKDRYSLAEIENLRPGDTVEVLGKTYTVELLIIHGWYDSDGDGDYDTGTITVKDPEQVKDLLDKHELVISDEELVPSSYEIYTREDFDGYIAFTVGENGLCHPLINDETFCTQVGTVQVPLQLPEGFVCHIFYEFNDSEDIENGTARDFLTAVLDGLNRYNDTVRFEDGKLVEAWITRW